MHINSLGVARAVLNQATFSGAAAPTETHEDESRGLHHWIRKTRLLATASVAALSFALPGAFAATTTVSVLIDADNNVGTGCSIATANGAFAGVDRVLNTTVVTDAAGYRTQSITLQFCNGAALSAAQVIDSSALPIARGNGTGGTTAIETYVSNSFLPVAGQKLRIGVTTVGADGLTGSDALTLNGTGPILVDGPPLLFIPTLATGSLALTALLLVGSLWLARRRGWNGMQLAVVMVFALSLSGQLIAAIVRDGLIADWTGISPAAVDPAGDAPPGTDITNLYSTVENGNVFFRIDTMLNSPPVANAQSVTAVIGASVAITLTGSDFEASPLSFAVVTPPTQGVLSGTPPNLTYTPNAGAGVSDSFTFKTNDGSADSAPAFVSIDIKRPPTITSVNNATFIPGQANTFTFTATGVPSANLTLSACSPALPATISVTNNGNNTATLAGNPTVAQGGTYLCTLTASNGFGSDATQPFTVNLGLPPTFTSANATTFTTGTAGTFPVTTTATPATTSITQTGALPSGVTLSYASGLNATLAGTPAAGTGGTYPITLTAGNGIPPNSTQSFTLTVNQAPAITSANSLICIVGVACSLPIAATGFPLPTIAVGGAALPGGITFAAGTPGNGTLSGTATAGGVGTYAITFTASNSTAPNAVQNFTLTVNKASTTTALTSGTNPSIAGQAVTFTATVTPQGTGAPTGGVTFNDGATPICSNVAVNGSGVATCTTSTLSVAASPHSMTAVYAGDASFTTSTSVPVSQVVTKANATTALATSVNPSNFGQSVTFTATVIAVAPASGTPSGTVTFNDGATALCGNVPVNGAGIATCTTAALSTAASPHSVTATYNGDASFNASPASTAISQVVNKSATATALGSGTNPSVFGQSVTFTATVSVTAPGVGTPTGTVNFTDGAATVCANVPVNGAGLATCTTSTLSVSATHSVTASYSGDASFNASTNSALTQVVNKAGSTTSLASGTNPSLSGQSVTFTATVAAVAPGAGSATGTVAFNDGATVVCAAAAVSSGVATCTTSALSSAGSPHSMTATYSGDGNFNGSTSSPLSQVVNKANSISTVSSSKTPTVAAESVTFSATVAPVAPGSGLPSGTVTFNDGATPICANVALVAGGATCATAALTVNSHTITVNYSGDASFNTSTSAAITQVVGLAGTTTGLTTSGSPSTAGGSVTFTATVAPVAPATVTPTGTVTFNDGATPICSNVALVAGSAICATGALTVGNHSITAVYSGSVGFSTSTSSAVTQVVNPGPATHFTVSAPASTVSGTAFNITVTALDALNNVATGYRGTAHFTSTDGAATLPADYTFTAGDNGVKVLSTTLRTAGSRTITSTDTVTAAITGVSGAITVGAAGATQFTVSAPASTTAGAPLTFTVTARDASNNVATGYVGTVNFTSTDGAATLPVNYTFTVGDAGVHTFANGATLRTAGVRAITATDTVTASITGTSGAITVNAAATSTYAISAPSSTVSGTPISVTVTAQDVFGNTVTGYGGTVHFTSSDPAATLPADATLAAGVGTFSATLRTSGSRTVTATDTVTAAINKTSSAIVVNPGPATHFSVAAPASATGAVPFNFTVTALDAANNIATGYLGTVHFTSTDGAATLPVDYTFIGGDAGVKTRTATLTTNGAQTITATDTVTASITGTSNSIAVSTGPAITSPNSATFIAGTNSSFTITTIGTPTVNSITLTGCTLQAGLTFSYVSGSTATISGNASATGTVSCTVTANNGVPPAGTQLLTVTVNKSPTISAISNSTFSVGIAGSGTFTVTGFPAPTLALSGCTLPSGLSLVGNQITGTPNIGATTVNGCIVTATNGILPDAATAPFTVTITLPPPTVTTSGGTTAFTEDGPAVVVDSGLTIAQPGGTNLASGTVIITGGFAAGEDALAFTNQNGITGSYSAGTLTLTGSSSLANYQTALRSVAYNNTSQNPSTANRTVQFVVSDGSATSTPVTKTVSVTGINDAPVLATGSTLNYTENGAAAVINAVIAVSDVDSANLIGATVAITSGFVSGQDVLSYVNALGITGSFNPTTGVLTLSGTTTVANYQTALRNVQYSNLSNDPSNGTATTTSRTISYQVNDGGAVNNLSNIVTSTINVTAVNDPPIAIARSGLYAQAGIPITYPAGTLGGTDLEAGTTVTVVTAPDSLCGNCSLTINSNGSFVFTPPQSAAGTTANFTYHVVDNGNPAPGASGTSVTVSFNVAGPAIYFVKSAAVGAANCNLGSECTLATALANIGATTNARIFLNDAATYSGGATLNSGGWLVGPGVTGTTFDALFGIAPSGTGTLATRPSLAGARPTVQSTVTLNTSSAVRGLNISSGGATGMTDPAAAITGVTVSDVSVTTSTATAVNLSGTTSSNLSFTSINTNGAATGLLLTSTGGTFTVTGDGTGRANGSGGSITNATVSALDATTASGTITLNSMNVTLNTSAIRGMLFDNNVGGTLTANLTGMNFTGVRTSVAQNKALLQVETGAAANVTTNVQNSFFNGSRTYGMYATAAGTSSLNVTLNQSGFGTDVNTVAPVNQPGSSINANPPVIGMAITNSASSLVDYSVTNNTFWGANMGNLGAVYAVTISGAGTVAGSHLNGTFSGNKIGKTGIAGSGCSNNCAGLGLLPGIGGTFNATVSNNDIRQVNSYGINFANSVTGANGTSIGKFTNNTLTEPDTTGAPLLQRALLVTPGNSTGASANWCAQVTGNTVSGGWQAGSFIRISTLSTTGVLTIPGLTPLSGATGANVDAYIEGANTIGAGNSNATVGGAINGSASPCP